MLLNRLLQRLGVRTHNLSNLLAVLEQHESRHGADRQVLRHLGQLVDVNFVEARVGVLAGESVMSC